jgi:hypothetical protein
VRTLSACSLAIGLSVLPTSIWAAAPEPPSVTEAPVTEAPVTEAVTEPMAPPAVTPPPIPVEVDPRNYRMVLAGDILIGLSGAGMITMAVGLGIRSDAITQRQALTVSDQPDLEDAIDHQARRITTGSQLAITGGVAAAVLLGSGITLVALGYRRERLRRLSLPSASFGPQGVSLRWTLRF